MNIAIFGTGSVGQALANRLAELSHQVVIGTRNVENALAKTAPDGMGTPPVGVFLKSHPSISLRTFADAAKDASVIVLATLGLGAKDALSAAGSLDGKIILDLTNPLDFSTGGLPTLFASNDTSLGEQLQAAFPKAHFVKSLNTMYNGLMVNPRALGEDSTVFVSGNDAAAKATVTGILKEFGWKDSEILDLGDITTARGTESLLLVWLRVYSATKNGFFNFKVATGK
ncbi:MAG: NAD(P)-binding domain-containing protein [Saprospiraceae bacterium]|nr:NAD(P)-binding domain-containing protein [Saprospiraceae bacterium]